MSVPVRVRFAPSPTGLLHVGGVRSALFNWLWARHNDGVFILRLEDTDRARLVPGAADQISDSLGALGIAPDEGPEQGGAYGPYIQSERLDIYRQHSEKLLSNRHLYPCWCSAERLNELRTQAQANGVAFKYDRYCLDHTGDINQPHVLRFRIPDSPEMVGWDDAVRGRMDWKLTDLDDFVAIKSDGFPTYHFANIVDDHLMAISHVMRADEWLPSTPKHLLLFAALGWDPPVYAHLPAILGPDGHRKLSKRDGAQSVQEYIDQGYLPEALRCFLASLGWNDGTTQEIYSTPELVAKFSLDRIQKSPAKFDRDRLDWMNGVVIRALSEAELMERTTNYWPAEAVGGSEAYRLQVLGLVRERLKFLGELPELTSFFFIDSPPATGSLLKVIDTMLAKEYLLATISGLAAADWNKSTLEAAIRNLADQMQAQTKQYFGLLRLSLTGRTAAPGLFETMTVLGRETVLRRLQAALASLNVDTTEASDL